METQLNRRTEDPASTQMADSNKEGIHSETLAKARRIIKKISGDLNEAQSSRDSYQIISLGFALTTGIFLATAGLLISNRQNSDASNDINVGTFEPDLSTFHGCENGRAKLEGKVYFTKPNGETAVARSTFDFKCEDLPPGLALEIEKNH